MNSEQISGGLRHSLNPPYILFTVSCLLFTVLKYVAETVHPLRINFTFFNGFRYRATGFVGMPAIGELAFAAVGFEFDEAVQYMLFIKVDR